MNDSLHIKIIAGIINCILFISVLLTLNPYYSIKTCNKTCYRDIEADSALAKYTCFEDNVFKCPSEYVTSISGATAWFLALLLATMAFFFISQDNVKACILCILTLAFMQLCLFINRDTLSKESKVEWLISFEAVYMKEDEGGKIEICGDEPCKD